MTITRDSSEQTKMSNNKILLESKLNRHLSVAANSKERKKLSWK